ncbi:MAG: hypothetical protein K1X75_04955 [Leptospirales bacterium]|nr:hypothetical protein [Leptospirales bacterium]
MFIDGKTSSILNPFLLLLAALAFWPIGAESPPPAVELRIGVREISHREPWRREQSSFSVPAFSLDGRRLAALNPRMLQSTGALVRPTGASDYSLNYIWFDPELGLSLLQVDAGAGESMPGRLELGRMDYGRSGQTLEAVGAVERRLPRRSVVYEEIVVRHTPWGETPLPALRLSGWQRQSGPGELLLLQGKLVGVVFEEQGGSAYALPAELIQAFWQRALRMEGTSRESTEQQMYSALPWAGFHCRPLSDAESRAHYGVEARSGACIVTEAGPDLTGASLTPGDVIVGINGRRLPDSAMLAAGPFGPQLPPLAALFQRGSLAAPGDRLLLDVVRGGERRSVELKLGAFDRRQLRCPREFDFPAYWVVGGLVFVELSDRYLRENPDAPWRLRYLAQSQRLQSAADGERFVVLDRVLQTQAAAGYQCDACLTLTVNGVAVRNLRQLKRLAIQRLSERQDLIIGLEGGATIALAAEQIAGADQEVRQRYGIEFLEGGPGEAGGPRP